MNVRRDRPHAPCAKLSAFTLVELLLVMAIMGVLAAMIVPNLARSVRGNRIRVATRAVVTAGRYARNISILRESGHALVFDIDRARIYVSESVTSISTNSVKDPEAELEETAFDAEEEADPVVFASDRTFSSTGEFTRELTGVTIESVELGGEDPRTVGSIAVVFESNGRCTPYVVTLADESGKKVIIDVDALAATETEMIE